MSAQNATLVGKVELLRALDADWDGAGAPAPLVGIPSARAFAEALGHLPRLPSVGPANDGGVVFEWDFANRVSVYCYAREQDIEITAFNDEKDLVEISGRPEQAAALVRALLSLFDNPALKATS